MQDFLLEESEQVYHKAVTEVQKGAQVAYQAIAAEANKYLDEQQQKENGVVVINSSAELAALHYVDSERQKVKLWAQKHIDLLQDEREQRNMRAVSYVLSHPDN